MQPFKGETESIVTTNFQPNLIRTDWVGFVF